jgi:hypothetical protein
MGHSSIETLEPRWAPARLVAGPLPAEFGVDLSASVPELEELVVGLAPLELPEFRERLAAYLAAGGDLGETSGSVTFFNRPDRESRE